jgi:fibro-slime domain-containing protein
MSRRYGGSLAGTMLASVLVLHCGSNPGAPNGPGGGAGGTGAGSGGSGGGAGGPSVGGGAGFDFGGFGGEGGGAGGSSGAGGAGPGLEGCGDGVMQSGEACDDGNGASGDGCAADCAALEGGFACPMPGQACVSTVVCGDGAIGGAELCDDGNEADGDGCAADCSDVEPGWTCLMPGLRCAASECGDGLVAGFEECDFEPAVAGCSACRIEVGYDCGTTSSGCVPTICGNDVVEHGEQCEDGNAQPFDGCFDCRREPACEAGVCESLCGDGQRYDDEACDDGNTRDGDGCSSTCEVELGYACTPQTGTPPATVELPIVYRDFIGEGNSLRSTSSCYDPRPDANGDPIELPSPDKPEPCFHIDFNGLGGDGVTGVVENELGEDGRPVYACPDGECDQNPGYLFRASGNTRPNFNGAAPYAEWYDSASPNNIEIVRSIVLDRDPAFGTYVFDATDSFYPINDAGWVLMSGQESLAVPTGACANNVSFTSEAHFWFEYQGGEQFEFDGDDDLWVFVNRKLAIDLGGLHVSQTGSFVLDEDSDGDGPDTADGSAAVVTPHVAESVDLGLNVGGVYEIVLFHAERNECGSNFKVTLKDFNRPKSVCASTCGDGVVASDELCDDGSANNDGAYGRCGPDCLSRGPYCGDGTQQSGDGEECDDGENLTGYGSGCAPGCRLPAACGDGTIDAVFGEQCDDGVNDGSYGGCTAQCQRAERCGDGTRQANEPCDDGNLLSGDGCSARCTIELPR